MLRVTCYDRRTGRNKTVIRADELAAVCNELIPAILNCEDADFQPGDIDAFDVTQSNGGGHDQPDIHVAIGVHPLRGNIESDLERRSELIEEYLRELFPSFTFDACIDMVRTGYMASVQRKTGRKSSGLEMTPEKAFERAEAALAEMRRPRTSKSA